MNAITVASVGEGGREARAHVAIGYGRLACGARRVD